MLIISCIVNLRHLFLYQITHKVMQRNLLIITSLGLCRQSCDYLGHFLLRANELCAALNMQKILPKSWTRHPLHKFSLVKNCEPYFNVACCVQCFELTICFHYMNVDLLLLWQGLV